MSWCNTVRGLSSGVEVRCDAAVHPAPLPVGSGTSIIFDVLTLLRALDDRPQEGIDVCSRISYGVMP
jgi:hypothetical protein